MQTIDTTLGALVEAEAALTRLIALRLPLKAAYHLKKLLAAVKPELQHFHELRIEIVKELGVSREPNSAERGQFGPEPIYEVLPTQFAAFKARIEELRQTAVSLAWGPFDLAAIGGQEISAADIDALGPLATYEDAGPKPG